MVPAFFRFGQSHKTVFVIYVINDKFRMFRSFRFTAFGFLIPSEMKNISFSARCFSPPPLRILCQLDGLFASRAHVLENAVILAVVSRAYSDDPAEQVTYHHVIAGYEFHFVFHDHAPLNTFGTFLSTVRNVCCTAAATFWATA